MNTMIRIATVLAFTFILGSTGYACNCKNLKRLEVARDSSFNHSQLVFLGDLIEIDSVSNTYAFRLIEGFKGTFKDSIIYGKVLTTCSMLPRDEGKWLVYANIFEPGFIDISICSASRSEYNPICIGCDGQPEILEAPNDSTFEILFVEDKARINGNYAELIEQAKADWIDEIRILRQK